uniref:Zinc fingers and homeoboxes protein 1 n=1 Tax=Neolamprologus brichardi TaxID=32507 RepID=A0A3Q4GV55_NEOBR
MASRRKSTIPCMVPPRETVDSDQEMEDVTGAADPEDSNGAATVSSEASGLLEERGEEADGRRDVAASDPYLDSNAAEGGYECKYCSFQTSELNLFTMHVDTEHPDVVLNTSYVCMECDYHTKSYDTLLAHNARLHPGEDNFTRTMVKRNNETIFQQTVNDLTFDGSFVKVEEDEAEETARRGIAFSKTPIMRNKSRAEPKKFTAAHKMAVDDVIKVESDDEDDDKEPPALSPASIPTYNAAMDNNVLLTKFSEEQIKVWFSAQRLKHGVSWTPEEVEEARRKKFNGTVQTIPQTITVIPANIAATTNGLQNIFQTCQIVGQPGLVLTQVAGNSGAVPVASPITLTVAGVPGSQPKAAEPSTSESNAEMSSSSAGVSLGLDSTTSKPKKSKEQLAELKASYSRRQFATEAEISRLMQVTKLSKRAIKKWFSDTRYNQRNSKDHHTGSSSDLRIKFRHAFPDFTPQKFKEKTPEQLLVLEASFQKSDTPSDEELSRLRAETKLTRREVDAWFTERRKMPSAGQSKDSDAEGDDEKAKPAAAPSPSAQERQGTPPFSRKLVKKTPEQLHILKKAFVHSQWPTSEEYDQMAKESGLPRTYIVNWFGDTRYACKNSNLKWYYLYQSGKVKSGKAFLKEYYLKHRALSEKDLDELVAKSSMSYEQVRDWFSETARRAEEGAELFSDEEAEGEEEDEEEEEEATAAEHADSEGEMEVKEQGEEASDDDCVEEDEKDAEEEEEDEEIREGSEGFSQSQPQAEEQT